MDGKRKEIADKIHSKLNELNQLIDEAINLDLKITTSNNSCANFQSEKISIKMEAITCY